MAIIYPPRVSVLSTFALLLMGTGLSAAADVPSPSPPKPANGLAGIEQLQASEPIKSNLWLAAEKQEFSSLLAGQTVDWVVAPVQQQLDGFDSAQRSLMSAALANAIRQCGQSVANPYWVQRALGESARRVPMPELDSLIASIESRSVVVPYAGHDNANHLFITLAIYQKPNGSTGLLASPYRHFTWQPQTYSTTVAPISAFLDLIPDMLAAAGIQHCSPASDVVLPTSASLPASPDNQTSGTTTSKAHGKVVDLAVLAALMPPAKRATQRAYEQVFLATRQAAPSPQRAFFEAWSLFHLNLRPAALAVLSAQHSAGITALKAIMDGNLIGTDVLIRSTAGVERLILEVELNDLEFLYQRDKPIPMSAVLTRLGKTNTAWRLLLERRWWAYNGFDYQTNAQLKALLDERFPIPGESLTELVEAYRSTPGRELRWSDVELTPVVHIRRARRDHKNEWARADASASAYLDLIESWAAFGFEKSVIHPLFKLGLPEQAQQRMQDLNPTLAGQPDFEVLWAQTEQALAGKRPDTERAMHDKAVSAHAIMALAWAGGQTQAADEAIEALRSDPRLATFSEGYGADYPLNPNWVVRRQSMDAREMLERCRQAFANTQTAVEFAESVSSYGDDKDKEAVLRELKGRFSGNPDRQAVLDRLMPVAADRNAQLREAIKEDPDNWENYQTLAEYLISEGEFADAAEVAERFPAFSDPAPRNPVEVSNRAADLGNKFYWHGRVAEARRLYRIALHLGTGAEFEMAADMRMSLMDGDLQAALRKAHARAERYENGWAYRDYLSLLQVLGRSSEASSVFNLLLDRPLGAAPWEAMMIGQRIAGLTSADVKKWLATPVIRDSRAGDIGWQSHYLLMWNTTDRRPDADLADQVRILAHEPRGISEGTGYISSFPGGSNGQREQIRRSNFRNDHRPALKYGDPVFSEIYLVANTIVPFQSADYTTAISRFDDVAARVIIERPFDPHNASDILPAFALASIKTGDPLKLEAFLETLPKDQDFPDLLIARAYFESLVHHDNNSALITLRKAYFRNWHLVAGAPPTEYIYADAAETLYKNTNDVRFRDEALRWVRDFQKVDPLISWAYTIEAELTPNTGARRAALVKALYLDPLSPRLKGLPKSDLDYPRNELLKGNPFLRGKPAKAVKPVNGQVTS